MSLLQRALSATLALTLGGAVWACGGGDRETLVITGSSTVAPLMGEIAKRFEESHPGVRIDVQTGGSSRGIADARQGLADIGMVSRDPAEDEMDLSWHALARDGVTLIVDASNPVQSLTSDQVRAIYRRQITSWSEVGGKELPITLVHKAEGRSTLELFLDYFELENSEIQPDVVVGDNEQGIKTVAGDPRAIGYVSIGTAEFQAGRGTSIHLVDLDGVDATVAAVAAGRFPLSRTLHAVTRGEPAGVAREFLGFAQSAKVEDLVEGQFFVPLER